MSSLKKEPSDAHLFQGGTSNSNMHMNFGSSSGRSAKETESRIGLLVSSFSSLLSFAHSDGVQLPTGDTSRKLSTLLSRFSKSSSSSSGGHGGSNLSSGTCSLPCLRIRSQASLSNRNRFQDASLQDIMACNLSAQVVTDRGTIDMVPKFLLLNTASSFEELISSRLRVSMKAITRTFLKIGGEGNEARVLRKLLSTSKPVKVTTVVTSYQLVNTDSTPSLNDGVIVRPLVFETIFDLSIFGKMYTISLEVPGTISASLNNMDNLLDNVEIMFDTMSLLKAMMTQARAVVKKAVQRAANITTTVSTYQQMKQKSSNGSSQNKMQGEYSSFSTTSSNNSAFANQNQQQQQSSNGSSSKNNAMTAQDELLASYPEHLRETVSHFLPEAEITEDLNVEGFPPNLLQTLKSLSGGEDGLEGSNEYDQHLPSNNNELHQGLFSWMNNDDIMLSQAKDNSNDNIIHNDHSTPLSSFRLKRQNSTQGDYQHPLMKKSKKVSFSLPVRN